MVAFPALDSEGRVNAIVYSNDKPVEAGFVSLKIEKGLNRIPRAQLVFDDGDMEAKDFPVSNDKLFQPGADIRIDAGYGNKAKTVFRGVVIRHGIRIAAGNYSRLVVDCRDPAYRMTLQRKNVNYVQMSDSEIIQALVKTYSSKGLSVKVDSSAHKHLELVQYYCTDWDYLVSRAEMSGMVVIVEGGDIVVKAPVAQSPELNVTWGDDLLSFDATMDARSQVTSVKSVAWNPKKQELMEKSSNPIKIGSQGNLGAEALASDIGNPLTVLRSGAPQDDAVLAGWAKSQQVKSSLARIRGCMTFRGHAEAKPGATVELNGVGERFSGSVLISGVTHEIAAGEWVTEADIGLAPDWFTERKDIEPPKNAGMAPGVDGLQIGRVEKLDEDPDGNNRIQVSVPVLDSEKKGVWARLANFYGSSDFGAYFLPEIGDEVVLGYFNSDPASPVILGSLYSSARPPPYPVVGENPVKAIVTREKLTIEFKEKEKQISIFTPGKNKIVLSDEDESILIEDKHGNSYKSNKSGITLTSKQDIVVNAKGKVAITGKGGVDMGTSAATTNIKGSTVNIN